MTRIIRIHQLDVDGIAQLAQEVRILGTTNPWRNWLVGGTFP